MAFLLDLSSILRGKSLAISYNGFPIGHLFSIRSFLLAGVQTCKLFENYQMDTCKRSKETNSDFIARIRSAEHFNFKRYSIAREVILKNMIFQLKTVQKG